MGKGFCTSPNNSQKRTPKKSKTIVAVVRALGLAKSTLHPPARFGAGKIDITSPYTDTKVFWFLADQYWINTLWYCYITALGYSSLTTLLHFVILGQGPPCVETSIFTHSWWAGSSCGPVPAGLVGWVKLWPCIWAGSSCGPVLR